MAYRTAMEDNQKLLFHGVWVAGLKVSDRLVKSIAMEFTQKPSRPCTLTLTFDGLDLQVLPLANGDNSFEKNRSTSFKSDKSQHILFSALREFSLNQHNQHCLMVIFVDSKNRFSVLVFSCENPRTLWEITENFKEIRNRKVLRSLSSSGGVNGSDVVLTSGNWTLRQQVSSHAEEKPIQIHAANSKGVSETLRFSTAKSLPSHSVTDTLGQRHRHQRTDPTHQRRDLQQKDYSDAEQAVSPSNIPGVISNGGLEDDGFERELVNSDAINSPVMFNVSLQVDGVETAADNDSVFFSGSFRGKASNPQTSQPDSDSQSQEIISSEEYHSFRNRTIFNGVGGSTSSVTEDTSPSFITKDHESNPSSETAVAQTLNGSDFALRNVGTQTEPMTPTPQRGRYTKKPLNPSLSNQYKEKVAAVRKKSGSGSGTSATSSTNGTTTVTSSGGTPVTTMASTNTVQGELLQATAAKSVSVMRPKSMIDSVPVQQRPVSKSLSSPPLLITSGSTVSRPIETVYSPRLQYTGQEHHSNQRPQDAEQRRQGQYPSGAQRVVVLPNKQTVRVYHPIPLQRQYLSATPGGRVRRTSNSSTNSYAGNSGGGDGFDSRNSSRNNSLRARGPSGPHQPKRVVSTLLSPRQLTHLS